MSSAFIHALLQAAVIGAFGGAGLVLTQVYSRRGPLVYPVYAAILVGLAFSLTRATDLGFLSRFRVAFAALLLSTLIAMAGTIVRAARARERLFASGRPLASGGMPLWASPLLFVLFGAASAAAAYVSM